jgi:hypothetical protein
MRRALALAALIAPLAAMAAPGSASAEKWTKYVDVTGGTQWSYDADYSYKDKQTGRLVVMQAVSKPSANVGPSGPGKPDGIGSVVAIDCAKKNMIPMGGYTPGKNLDIKSTWRSDTPKKADGPENEALVAAVCATESSVPSK